jgi:enoyl-CoA hydratase
MVKTSKVLLKIEGPIATITMNRPEVLNAMDGELWQGLAEAGDAIRYEREVRVVIITGAGDRAFSSGLDLKQATKQPQSASAPRTRDGHDALTATKYSFSVFEELSVPVIAAINGYCLGGGLQLALACDIRIAADNAMFSCPEVSLLGIVPDLGGTQRLPRIIGPGQAKRLIFTGRRIDAAEAVRIGLVDEVHPKDSLTSEVRQLAEQIAACNPAAVQGAKRAINIAMSHSMEVGLSYETATALSIIGLGNRISEGAAAFWKEKKT